MGRFAICMTLLLALLAQPAQAAGLGAELQARYAGMKTFTAVFNQTLTHKESGMKEARTGRLAFAKPQLIRWEAKAANGGSELLVVGAREIWNYLPEEEIAYRMPLSLVQDSRSIIQVVTGQARLDRDFDVKEQGMENDLLRLRLYPREPLPQMVEASVWVAPGSKLIRRVLVTDFYGNTNDIVLTDIVPDAAVPASSFQFTPPRGVTVEDRMDPSVQERELFQ
ncbi:MAG: outer membrane lipoprotein carrier protein LolA [Desulfovibrionaceae bacterium]|nr:outer-membrane lipoprotein carrier protein LolA [Desulfovibrionaceae bacterium]